MTTEHPETAPESAGAATEPNGVVDDTSEADDGVQATEVLDKYFSPNDDEHPFSAEDYAARAAEAEQEDDDGPQGDGDEVQRLRRESARRRVRLHEAEANLEAAQAEGERLGELVSNLLKENVERAAADKMIDPRDLWRVVDLDAVLNADGTGVDPVKVSAAIAQVPAHWLKQSPAIRTGDHGLASGATGRAPAPRRTTWASAIGPLAE